MRLEDYFTEIHETIDSHLLVQTFQTTFDKRTTRQGFIRGEIRFVDDSVLHFREYVDVEYKLERFMYVYHYVDASNELIFRYDNTGHHKDLGLPTYPHHKHAGSETNIVAAKAPTLAAVLAEIEPIISVP